MPKLCPLMSHRQNREVVCVESKCAWYCEGEVYTGCLMIAQQRMLSESDDRIRKYRDEVKP